MATALITGITGQDGSYLAQLLLEKNYKVVGMVSSLHNIGNQNIAQFQDQLILEPGDLLDKQSLDNIVSTHKPDEIYNLAGLTFPPASWEKPTLTLDINTLGLTRILEIISQSYPQTRLYQASSSKIFGNPNSSPQTESTTIEPLDPYSESKASAHRLISQFRNHFGIFACAGIMFNHESPRRGPEFVTRKITQTAAKIKLGQADELVLGDLEARVDWGYAPDYVKAMWLMLQQDSPDDFIIATGSTHSIKQLCQIAFSHLDLDFQKFIKTDPKFIRKEKIIDSCGDYSKAKSKLGWQPETSFEDMIKIMVDNDINLLKQHQT